jgi:hypothetical protein
MCLRFGLTILPEEIDKNEDTASGVACGGEVATAKSHNKKEKRRRRV